MITSFIYVDAIICPRHNPNTSLVQCCFLKWVKRMIYQFIRE